MISSAPAGRIDNACGFEFKSKPERLDMVLAVKFDCTRQRENRVWKRTAGTWQPFDSANWPAIDTPNDESATNTDNDNIPDHGDHLYSLDAPGWTVNNGFYEGLAKRTNFKEYVRVRLDGAQPDSQNPGSRCSDKIKWHELLYIERVPAGGGYQLIPGKTPEVALEHIDVDAVGN